MVFGVAVRRLVRAVVVAVVRLAAAALCGLALRSGASLVEGVVAMVCDLDWSLTSKELIDSVPGRTDVLVPYKCS